MRITPIAILLFSATSAAAQQPPRRLEHTRALQALIEAQARSADSAARLQRSYIDAVDEVLALNALRSQQSAELLHALEARREDVGRLHTRRALVEALVAPGTLDALPPDAGFEAFLDAITVQGAPEPWAVQDPADSLYRAGREQLNAGEYGRAARTFERIRADSRFRQSQYRPAAYYWEAFARSRTGSAGDLRQARELLREMEGQFRGDSPGVGDASELAATIDARLARLGDERALVALQRALETTSVTSRAHSSTVVTSAEARRHAEIARTGEGAARVQGAVTAAGAQCPGDDIRTVALNALLQMDPDQAVPLLREIMERRDECSVQLRRRAMMMLAERQDAETQAILIEAALRDPDPEVRMQATFWLSHVPGEAAVEALARILAENPTPAVRERAIFALGQQPGPRAAEILREYALRADLSEDLRRQIVYSLAHSDNALNADFLRQLYERTSDAAVKEQIVVTLAQDPSRETADWILRLATDPDEPASVRRHAILMVANAPDLETERLVRLYDETRDADLRRHLLTVLGQRVHSDPVAVGKLVDIARTTDDANLQRTLVYLLSESRDPRAIELMAEIIRRR